MNLIFAGPEGSGKTTQARIIARTHNLYYLGTGELFRKEIEQQTDLGKTIKEQFLDQGKYVADELVMGVVKKYVTANCKIAFDGVPRTQEQLLMLNQMLDGSKQKITAVFYFDLDGDDNMGLERCLSREVCRCGAVYGQAIPPTAQGQCTECQTQLKKRPEDTQEKIARRLQEYHYLTKPMIEKLQEQDGLVRRIDATQSPADVFYNINLIIAKIIRGTSH
jgi:adenylate kinase